jgi:subtilisin family serine protease/GH25 family lysozyme M1 (1,4-beta-N-acetylmuramidase)
VDPALWELLRAEAGADGDRAFEAIIRLAQPGIEIPDVRIVSRFGTIATCRIRARDIVPVRARHDVVSLKAARGLSPGFEPTVAVAVPDTPPWADFRPTDVRRSPGLTLTGKGVVVASIDWGVDVDSASFRWAADPADADGDRPAGGTRFLSFWDQRDLAAGPRPDPYGYGTVHDREQIDRALRDPKPYEQLGYHPAIADRGGHGSHGTHVLDIAAGNGQAGGPAGIAPKADLIFVHLADRTTGGLANLGDSVRLLEAVDFISRTAGSQPCVINISAGRTCGPKDGTTLVERALDELLAANPGRFVVNSAGNYFGWRTHACGRAAPGESRSLTFIIDPGDITINELEIWYDGADEFAVRIDPPGYTGGRAVRLGERSDLLIEGEVIGRVYHRKHDPNNGDNHIVAYIEPIARAGNWTVTLEARQVKSGRFHAWIERDDACRGCQARFTPADTNPATTIGTITTSRLPLIIGAYDGHDPARPVAPFSSSGPSRDLRPKPDLVAPGVDVLAARSASIVDSHNPGLLVRKSGTSMATPHVTGAVALCLEAAGNTLSARQIRSLVLASCDPARDPDAPYRLGRGYLNIPRLIADLQRTLTAPGAKEPTMNTDDNIGLLAAAPATAYREYLYRPHSQLARWIDEQFDVVAKPGQRIDQALQLGDVLLDVTLGHVKPGRCLVLTAHDPELEVSPRRLSAGQLLLRPRKRAEMSEPLPVEPTVGTEGSNPAADVAAGASAATAAAPSPPRRIDGMDLNARHVFPPIADLRADGIRFGMLKATEGRTFLDKKFSNRRTTARAEHFLSGPYHYYRGDAAISAQADNFVASVARLLPGDLPPAFDFEKGKLRPTTPNGDGAAAAGLVGAQWLDPLESFLDRVETGLGRTPMIYTSWQVWRDYVRDDPAFARFRDYPLWVKYQQDPATGRYARRLTLNPRLPAPWNDWAIWQYSLDYTPSEFTNLHHADRATDLDISNGGIHVLRGLANLGRPAPHGSGIHFVAHSDENGVIRLLTFVGIWLESSLSDLAQSGGTAKPLAAGDVTACDLGDRQFAAFRERSDGHLCEIQRQNGTFSVVDITSVTGTTNAAGDPTYVTSGSDRHLVCRGDDNHQYLFSNIANGGWQARDVTAGAGIATASGQATAYVFGGDVHVVSRAGTDGHLIEAWHDGKAWNVVDRTAAGVPAATYQPSTYLGTDGFVRVVYRAVRGSIHESDHHVTDLDLAQAAGGAPTAAGSPVCVMAGQVPHIIYRRPDGFLHEIFWNGAAWAHGPLPCLERAAADPAALVTTEAGAPVLVVTFRRRDGAMEEVALRGGTWRCEAIEPVPNEPPADSDAADGDTPPFRALSTEERHWTYRPAASPQAAPASAGPVVDAKDDNLGAEEDTTKKFTPPIISNLSGNVAFSHTITWGGRSVNVHYFPGTSGQTVLILGGVHQDERKALALSSELLKQLQSSKDKLFNSIVFIPNLFGGRNLKENSIDGIPANRNSPGQNESLADSANRGNGVPKDTTGLRDILPENVILFKLVEVVKPRASLSLHSHRPITDPKEIVEQGAASVTVDPRPGGEEAADYLTREMALAASKANVPVPGNQVTGDTARTRYPTEWATHEPGVTFGQWGSHHGGMNQYLIETEGKPWPDHPSPSQQAEISGWTQVIWSTFLADPRDVTATTLARDLAKESQALTGKLNW